MNEADEAADLFQDHRDELGFVTGAQCEEKALYTEYVDGVLVGAALANHCERKPQTTLYDIAVCEEHRGEGVASRLVNAIALDAPHERLVAKCPADLPANKFYAKTGWALRSVEPGNQRRLCVWELDLETDVVITVKGYSQPLYNAIDQSPTLMGWETANTEPRNIERVEFCDFPFTKDKVDIDEHVEAVRRANPKYAVAPDIEQDRSFDDVLVVARRLERHAENVIMVPKSVQPTEVPSRFVIGYPNQPNFGSNANWPWEQYRGRRVHILGGRPSAQLNYRNCWRVSSVDTTLPLTWARWGDKWTVKGRSSSNRAFECILRDSLQNMHAAWSKGATVKSAADW